MLDFAQTNRLSPADQRRYKLDELRAERQELANSFMLSAAGKARLAELNAILGQ